LPYRARMIALVFCHRFVPELVRVVALRLARAL
jgi:hypothetical protein